MKDSKGNTIKQGDIVHNKWGYDLIVSQYDNGNYYGKLVCDKGHSCENIPYALVEKEITLIHK